MLKFDFKLSFNCLLLCSNAPYVFLGWTMNQFLMWSHSYKPDFQEEPLEMPGFGDMVDVKDSYTWADTMAMDTYDQSGSTACLAVTQSGLIQTMFNSSCDQSQGGLCEYRST